VACGANVSQWRVDDEVCALTPGGGYADYCVAPAAWCLPIPAGWTLEQAAGLPENYYTVWNNVFDRAGLRRGEWILIHGGTSGIGLTAIQLAKAFGATVITTAGSAEKTAFCIKMGADHAIDYKRQDFAEEVKRITAKRGVDVILDMVGGDYVERNLKCLALEGRLAQIAFLAGSRVLQQRILERVRRVGLNAQQQSSPSQQSLPGAQSLMAPPFIDGDRCTILRSIDESHSHTADALLRPRHAAARRARERVAGRALPGARRSDARRDRQPARIV